MVAVFILALGAAWSVATWFAISDDFALRKRMGAAVLPLLVKEGTDTSSLVAENDLLLTLKALALAASVLIGTFGPAAAVALMWSRETTEEGRKDLKFQFHLSAVVGIALGAYGAKTQSTGFAAHAFYGALASSPWLLSLWIVAALRSRYLRRKHLKLTAGEVSLDLPRNGGDWT